MENAKSDEPRYRSTINLDLEKCPDAERNILMKALEHAGWKYVGTSAMSLDAGTLDQIQIAFEYLARAFPELGTMTAVTVHAQRILPEKKVSGSRSGETSTETVKSWPLPA